MYYADQIKLNNELLYPRHFDSVNRKDIKLKEKLFLSHSYNSPLHFDHTNDKEVKEDQSDLQGSKREGDMGVYGIAVLSFFFKRYFGDFDFDFNVRYCGIILPCGMRFFILLG